ncbi:MAG: SpoIIE family protein phosphatase [Candidatus Wallbacteria bacterium]
MSTYMVDLKSDNTISDVNNSNILENVYDLKFLNFIFAKFFKNFDQLFYKNIADCGFIDIIDSLVFRYLNVPGDAACYEPIESQKEGEYFNWLMGGIGGVSDEIRPYMAEVIRVKNAEKTVIAFPINRIDRDRVNIKKLDPLKETVIKDRDNYYCCGYIYFVIANGDIDCFNDITAKLNFFNSVLNATVLFFKENIQKEYILDCKLRESRDYELLMSVANSIISSLDINDVLQEMVNGATDSLKSERGSLMLIDDSGDLVLRYGRGMKPELINKVKVKIGEGIAGSVAKSGEPLLITDIESSDNFKKKNNSKEFNNKSLLSVPLKVKDRVIGVFNINNKLSGDIYDHFDLKLLKALSTQAAIALENARHYQTAINSQRELEEQVEAYSNLYEEVHTLYEIVRAIKMLNDPNVDPRDRILELAINTLNATVGFLFLPHDNIIKAISIKGDYNDKFQFSKIYSNDQNLITKIIMRGQSVLITNVDQESILIEPEFLTPAEFNEDGVVNEIKQLIGRDLKSILIVPLFEKSNAIGVILIVNKKVDNSNFNEHDRNLLQILGEQISAIITADNLQREYLAKKSIEKELDVARNIQQKLIPKKPPVLPGIDIYAINKAAKTVSGDYYDFLNHDSENNKVGFVIADVSGKGIPAALIMSMTRAILRTQVVDNYSPADILYRTNNFLIKDIEGNRYVTMFYGMLDTKTLEYTYVKAGHNPPLWFHNNSREVEQIEASGFFVGMFEEARYEEKKIQLLPEDKLILFTDGIIEAMNENNEEYGLERFIDIIKQYSDFDARSLTDKVLLDIEKFVGTAPQSDDITMLIINVKQSEYTELVMDSAIEEVVKITNLLGDIVMAKAIEGFESCEIMMILDELLMNAIEHGNKFDRDKKVYVSYIFNDYKFEIIIRDEGEGFNVQDVYGTHQKISLYDKRGRGILIVKNLVDKIEYNKEGNEVRIVKFFR